VRQIATTAAAAVLATVAVVGSFPAWANIDPASDVLLLQDDFLPYEPKVCEQLSEPLTEVTKRTKKRGYPVKVAVIASEGDLGGAPQYIGRPQPYAKFLGGELGVFGPDAGKDLAKNLTLLTVMEEGFGYYRSGDAPNVSDEAKRLPRPSGGHPNDLVRAALAAVPRLAKAAGRPVAVPKIAEGCSGGGGGTSFLVFVVPAALLILVAGVLALRNRLGPQQGETGAGS
jgi:hypothetical protein